MASVIPEFRDARLEALRSSILSPAPIYTEMEEGALTAWFTGAKNAGGK